MDPAFPANGAAVVAAVVAAADIGSNTIKMSVATLTPSGELRELATRSETVRLGSGLTTSGMLAEDRMETALTTLIGFANIARGLGATRLVGVATEATRRAANGPAFLAKVRAMTGWDVHAIAGDEEAALTFRGLAHDHDLSGSVVVADIGGGSTEIVVAESGQIQRSQSIALGSGTLTDAFVHTDPPTRAEFDACVQAAAKDLAVVSFPATLNTHLTVLGGTAEHIPKLLPGHNTTLHDIPTMRDLVLATSAATLAAEDDIPLDRARVLPAGIAIISAIVDGLNPARISFARSGIRIGLLLATFDEIAGNHTPEEKHGKRPRPA